MEIHDVGFRGGKKYESPINMYVRDIQTKMVEEQEGLVMKAVRNVGVDVDKDELVKALNYDREQYEKGYQDGVNSFIGFDIATLDAIRGNLSQAIKLIDTLKELKETD